MIELAVAAGLIIDRHGRLLMTSRPRDKPYAGWWELPGGKIEPNETPAEAVVRELLEELGIAATAPSHAWSSIHDYPHARVHLNFYWIRAWGKNDPQPHEGQQLYWLKTRTEAPHPFPTLPATIPAIERVRLDRLLD
ncbi:MAG: (deoxy)nucleoside triphosphate pyrophosphohydrolase [Betaproteobacteria bacterium]|nr:(deoxy)nucleoside triphosphate pyrophosphohydrolase [Betaproteobacteria bacterium]